MSRHTDEASPNEEVESYRGVDISASFPHIASKEMSEGVAVSRHNDLNNSFHHLDSAHLDDQPFQQQILQLKKQQQLQQQILLQHFQQQQQQLAEQHEQQLRQHLKFWEQQRALEEQRERREREKLEALKRKEKHEQSAVASHEVKLRLQGFLLGKKQREHTAAATAAGGGGNASNGTSPHHAFRPWPSAVSRGGAEGVGAGGGVGGGVGGSESGPLYHPLLNAYDDDFPLRKTASEPNLLKVRLKQRVIERRANPIARRKDRPSSQRRRTQQMANSVCSGESGSPPANAPIAEECEAGSMADLSALYTSPSMPNISLGRPRPSLSQSEKLAVVSEAEVRAAFTARLGMPLTGQMLPGTLPFYPSLPVIDCESTESSASAMSVGSVQHRHMQTLEAAGSRVRITDSQVARARLHKQGHRPLVAIGRTQSAPLPLGRPAASFEEHQAQRTHNLLKQHIRQTVLTRTRNSQLEPELQPLERLEDCNNAEVIDLTDRRGERLDDRERQHFLQQQRDLMMRNSMATNSMASAVMPGAAMAGGAMAATPADLFAPKSHVARPLSRALSSPLVALSETTTAAQQQGSSHRLTTGLAFDSLMLKHSCVCGDNSSHPEHGGRLQSVWARLLETGLVSRCDRVRSRKATLEEIQACHSEAHALLFGTNPLNRQKLDMSKLAQLPVKSFVRLACGGVGVDSDTTWNELHTAPAARLAVGCVVDLAFKTALGDIRNGFAVVRPPGHHAEQSQAMGFCFFNSVAIAARLLQQRLALNKILIVDWDVHHGNGTQQAFYSDPRVLYLSLHRHDDGNFFPGTGAPGEVGAGAGRGATVNVAWGGGLDPPMGDAEYLAAFRAIVMPIARAFQPEIVLVSCGFDAASGHAPPLGGYNVSPACFGYMTQQLLTLADGKVVLSLEGGYDLPSICDSAQECVRALLGDAPTPVRDSELARPPNENAVATLRQALAIQLEHWPCLAESAALVAVAARAGDEEAVVAMAGLSMQHGSAAAAAAAAAGHQELTSSTEHSRSESEEPMEQEEEK